MAPGRHDLRHFWGGLADAPHPRWKILLLVYAQTDALIDGPNGTTRHVRAAMSPADIDKTIQQARLFVEQDIPALTSGQMLPTLTVRQPRSPLGVGRWPAPGDVLPDLDPAFDSVMVVWDSRLKDVATGESLPLGDGVVTYPRGLGQTYIALTRPRLCLARRDQRPAEP